MFGLPVGFSRHSSQCLGTTAPPLMPHLHDIKHGLQTVAQEPLVSSEMVIEGHEFPVNIFLVLCLISVIILRKKVLETCCGLSVEPLNNKGRSASEQRRK